MDGLAALELDVADDHDRLDAPPQSSSSFVGSSVAENGHAASGTRRRSYNGSTHGADAKNRKEEGVSETMPLAVYKLPLVWIDLEMTGLNVEVDIGNCLLSKSVEEATSQSDQRFMLCVGLTEKALQSTVEEAEVEKQKYMPDLARLFSDVLVDVSSVKALCIRWYPKDRKKAPTKENKYRATGDIRESITELKFYKENIFKLSKYRRLCLKLLASRPKLWLIRQSFLTGPDESLEVIGIVDLTSG